MSKSKKPVSPDAAPAKGGTTEKIAATVGRKRDPTRDAHIVEAALNILAEVGFDSMTMDMVATRAQAGKATVYRRWPSKAELVRDALIWMGRSSVDVDHEPDTGTLRGDLLAMTKPHSTEHAERKLRVLGGLGSFSAAHRNLAEEAYTGIFGRWTEVNRSLMQRAINRGEISAKADIEQACQIIVAMAMPQGMSTIKPREKGAYAALLDNILLPALKAQGKE